MRPLLVAALLVFTLAACGGTPVGPTPVTVRSSDPEENRQAAEQEAQRLLSLVRMPDGARPVRSAPRSIPGPVLGTPAVESVVDRSEFWRIGIPFKEALAWLDAHPPNGLSLSGSANVTGGGGSAISGRAYVGASTAVWQSAQLQIAVTEEDRNSSIVRADAMVVWLDPRPLADSNPGPRIQVTQVDSCPATNLGIVGVTNPGQSALRAELLPAEEPVAGLICEYSGLNGAPAFHLRRHRQLDAGAAERIARAVRDLSLGHTVGAATSCPADDGSVAVIALSFANRPDIDLWLKLAGCPVVTNGYILAAADDLRQAADL